MTSDYSAEGSAGAPRRVCFFFNAQRHQLLHGIATAVELARMPGVEVHVMSPNQGHVDYARHAVARLGGAPIIFEVADLALLKALRGLTGSAVPPKVVSLALLARRLSRFDAIAAPERTSILLRRLGASGPAYIHLDHGAGDRAAGFDPRIREFDMVLLPGEKHRARMQRDGLIRPGRYAVVGYPKFEAADAMRDPNWRPFADDRPIVLYNPHFSKLGSWEAMGEQVLKACAAQDRYNLIVAPHVRMLDGNVQRARWDGLIATYAACPNILFDTGSDRCIDMTYTTLADVYLGDVSSQVYEFLRTPKPCLFLDAHGVDWRGDENYAHWRFGPVATSGQGIVEAVDAAVQSHGSYSGVQAEGFDATFATDPAPASVRAARAIKTFLDTAQARPRRAPSLAQRAAVLAVAAGAGWLAHTASDFAATRADPLFVREAVSSHRTSLIRAAMRSQPEAQVLDRAEIRKATGIAAPPLPHGWRLTDVQVYPSDEGPLVQIAALTTKGEAVSLVAMKAETPASRRPLLDQHDGERIAYWEERGQALGVVGALPARRLLELAAQVGD